MAGKGLKLAMVSIMLLLIFGIIIFLVLLVINYQKLINLQSAISASPPCPTYYCGSGEYRPPGTEY